MKQPIYEGKCKKIWAFEGAPNQVLIEFKDSLTAFNGKKKSSFKGKGALNCGTSSLIFSYLKKKGIENHFIKKTKPSFILAQKVEMIPLEVVVRNKWAGSSAKKLNQKEGLAISPSLFELYYKDESLGDPFISGEQALSLGLISHLDDYEELKNKALQINQELCDLFSQADLDLIDFKLEFGKDGEGNILLADEVSADSCRIWERETGKKLDKDRFRLGLGGVEEGYRLIFEKLSKGGASPPQ